MPMCETVEDIATRCFYVVDQSFFVPIHKCGYLNRCADLPLVSQEMLPGEVVKLTFRVAAHRSMSTVPMNPISVDWFSPTKHAKTGGVTSNVEGCHRGWVHASRKRRGLRQLTAEQAGRIGGHCRDNIQAWRNGVPDNVVCTYRREEYQCGTDEGDTVCVDERVMRRYRSPHAACADRCICALPFKLGSRRYICTDEAASERQCARDHELPASNLPCP